MRKRRASRQIEPNGSIIVWLGGLVFGVCAGLLVVYHMLLSSRSTPLDMPGAQAAPAAFVRASDDSAPSVHREALHAAVKRRES